MSIPNKQHHEMSPDQARETVLDCVCAACYGQLTSHYNPKTRTSTVTCATAGCETPGFVTRAWYHQQQAISLGEKAEAQQVLQKAVPWMAPAKKSEAEILKELGF